MAGLLEVRQQELVADFGRPGTDIAKGTSSEFIAR
jgi:hypothetical protein